MNTQPSYDKLLDPIEDISASIEALIEGAFGVLMGDQRESLKRVYTATWALHTLFMDVITGIGLENLAKRESLYSHFERHLNPIVKNARDLLDEVDGPLNEEQEVCVQYIHETGLLLRHYIEKLWLYSRLHHGKVLAQKQSVLLEQVIPQEEWFKDEETLNLKLHLPDAPIALFIDKDLIRVALKMLLENALDAMDDDNAFLEIRARVDDGQVLIYVEDIGDGISAEYHERVFDAFFQIKPNETGLGLGLSIAREILHLHRGTVRVNPYYLDGTSIIVSIPLN